MKSFLKLFAALLVIANTAAADTVTLKNVHLCCGGCVRGVDKAVAKVKGVSADIDRKSGSVKLTGDNAALKKALAAIGNAGYTGDTDGPLKVPATRVKAGKVAKLTLSGVHLCCGACVKQARAAISKVSGVKGDTLAKRVKSFDVTGNFDAKALVDALAAAGFSGRLAH